MLGRGLPVLATIGGPAGEERWGLRARDFEALGEPLKRLGGARMLLVGGRGDLPRVLAISIAAAALAGGRRAIVVECDLARPGLAADLGLAAAPGLHEYLRWEATAEQLLQPVAIAGPAAREGGDPLVCVVAGRATPDPRTLLGHGSFAHMLERLHSAYALTVLIGPSFETASGGLRILAGRADASLLALPPSQATGRRGRVALRAARGEGLSPLGAVAVGES
jgi:hypothetical protein